MAGVRRARVWIVSALLALGFWQFGHGAYIPAKAWLAQELMQRAWLRTGEWRGARDALAMGGHVAGCTADGAKQQDIDLIVLAGGSGRTLAFGPGHLSASATPGQTGNTIIAGHRDTHFQFLRNVVVGELLGIETPQGQRHVYEVIGVDIVDARRGSLVLDTDAAMLTLVTCYPFDATRGRRSAAVCRYGEDAVLRA